MQEKQTAILKQALKIVPFDGWSDNTLLQATINAGYDPAYKEIAFKAGTKDLVEFFIRSLDEQMLKQTKKQNLSQMKIRDRIAFIIRSRLEISEQYKPAIKKNISYHITPTNTLQGTCSLYKTVDLMWYTAGDNSSDFNHYTKRITLAAVYSSTLLYWLKDDSENHAKTWEFLDRRIANVMSFHNAKAKIIKKFA